jgi:hypothetical protein
VLHALQEGEVHLLDHEIDQRLDQLLLAGEVVHQQTGRYAHFLADAFQSRPLQTFFGYHLVAGFQDLFAPHLGFVFSAHFCLIDQTIIYLLTASVNCFSRLA